MHMLRAIGYFDTFANGHGTDPIMNSQMGRPFATARQSSAPSANGCDHAIMIDKWATHRFHYWIRLVCKLVRLTDGLQHKNAFIHACKQTDGHTDRETVRQTDICTSFQQVEQYVLVTNKSTWLRDRLPLSTTLHVNNPLSWKPAVTMVRSKDESSSTILSLTLGFHMTPLRLSSPTRISDSPVPSRELRPTNQRLVTRSAVAVFTGQPSVTESPSVTFILTGPESETYGISDNIVFI